MKGLSISRYRFRKAKNLLLKLNLIEYIFRRNKKGQFIRKYIKINYIHNAKYGQVVSTDTTNRPPVHPPGGFLPPNAYYNNINAYHYKLSKFKKLKKTRIGFPESIKEILRKKKIIK